MNARLSLHAFRGRPKHYWLRKCPHGYRLVWCYEYSESADRVASGGGQGEEGK